MSKHKQKTIFIWMAILLLACFCFGKKARAAYHYEGTLVSNNLLSGLDVASIDSFGYNSSAIPAGTTLKVQFSQDNTHWYNVAGVLNGWDDCSQGSHSIVLSDLGWSGDNFYYQIQFDTTDSSITPVLDEISVNYTTDVIPPAKYNYEGTLVSNNLLSGVGDVASIDSFGYNASSILAGTSLKIQFSQDNIHWYNIAGELNGWDDCPTTGGATIVLSNLGWSGANFYYRLQFDTTDTTLTPVLDEISVNYNTGVSAINYSSGTLISTDLLSGDDVASIDSFGYNASAIPVGTTLKVQFSQDNTTWKNSSGTIDGWDDCLTTGGATIDLSGLDWLGPDSYYKMQFDTTDTSDLDLTPVLDEISLSYNKVPAFTSVSDSPDPQASSSDITFASVASDPDAGDTIKLYICQDAACANCGPADTSNCRAVSAVASETNPSAAYACPSCDYSTNEYWAKVCDSGNLCSDIEGSPVVAGYNYRAKIPVNSTAAGAQTDYQMKITVYKGTGVNSAGEIYLNDHSLAWPNDIRFAGISLKEYWLESSDATQAVFWIKLDTPASGATDYYIYYGKEGDSSGESSGDDIFEFFDDFTGTEINTSKWSVGSGEYYSQDDELIVSGGPSGWTTGMFTNDNFTREDLMVETKYMATGGSYGMWGVKDTTAGYSYTTYPYQIYAAGTDLIIYENNNSRGDKGDITNDIWYNFRIRIKAVQGATYYYKELTDTSYTQMYDSDYSTQDPIKIGFANHSRAFKLDNFLIRQYADPEPAWAAPGGEGGMPSTLTYSCKKADGCGCSCVDGICEECFGGYCCDSVCQAGTCNYPPAFTSVSDSPDPQKSGEAVIFSSIASDPEGDKMKLYVCKNGTCASCEPGAISECWAVSTEAQAATSNPQATYDSSSDPDSPCEYATHNYWAKVCDVHDKCSGVKGE